MKRLLAATLAVGLLTVSAPIAAHASHTSYRGGCTFVTLNDTTPGGQLGGQDVWNGGVAAIVVATDSSANTVPMPYSITAWCEVTINGVSVGPVAGPQSGTGAVVLVGQLQYTASTTDVISICTHVVVDGETHADCDIAVTTQLLPEPVLDVLDLVVGTAFDAANQVFDLVRVIVLAVEPTVCTGLIALAPLVNLLPPSVVHVDTDGDLLLNGWQYWDCPPYGA